MVPAAIQRAAESRTGGRVNMADELEMAASPMSSKSALLEWRGGWAVVVAGLFGNMLLNVGFMSMGTFMSPLENAFGWSRAEISSGFGLYAIAGIILSPLVGILIDKWGVARVAVPGSLLVGVTFSLFATSNGSLSYWMLLWLLFASANQLIMITVFSAAVAGVFVVGRGLALSVMMLGSGLAAMVMPVIANQLMEHYDWRTAFICMGLGWGSGVALICFLALGKRSVTRPAAGGGQPMATGMTVREGLLSIRYAKLAVVAFIVNMLSLALTVHLIPVLTASGVSRDAAIWITGIYGVTMIAGKIAGGVLIDRLPVKPVTTAWLAIMVGSFVILRFPGDAIVSRIVAVTLFGLASGGLAPVIPYLVSRYFGLRSFGRLFGLLASAYALALAVGPFIAGLIYDQTQSYNLLLAGALPALAVAALLILTLGDYPDFDREAARKTS